MPPLRPISTKEKYSIKQAIAFLKLYFKNFQAKIILCIVLSVVSVMASVFVPSLIGSATDQIITKIYIDKTVAKINNLGFTTQDDTISIAMKNLTKIDGKYKEIITSIPKSYRQKVLEQKINNQTNIKPIIKTLLIAIVIVLISISAAVTSGLIISSISQNIAYSLRSDINRKINKLPLNYFDKTNKGEILSFLTNDVDAISSTITQAIAPLISSLVTFIGIIIMMLIINLLMAIIILLTIPVSIFIIMIMITKSQKYFNEYQDYLGKINGHVEETYAGQKTIKLYNLEQQKISTLRSLNNTLYNSSWKSTFLSGIMNPIMAFFGNLSYVIGCIVGGYLVITSSGVSIGDVQAFITYARNLNRPLANIASLIGVFQQAFAAANRIEKFINEPEEVDDVSDHFDNGLVKGNVEFKDVTFAYKNTNILTNLNFKVKEGEKIAIVGPTGAGKTTIVKLLMNYYDLNSGQILIDKKDIKNLSKEELRSHIGIVLQEPWVFKGTIKANILYGHKDYNAKRLDYAINRAGINHLINTLPKGLEFEINNDGTNISDGEKQLITIARSIYNNPDLLILDEATSAVDTRTEYLMTKAMNELMNNKTCFIIAHRLSTIKDADKIIVINDGTIMEIGNHQQLLKKNGFYKEIYMSQFK